MNFRLIARASRAACTGPRMVSSKTRVCAASVKGRGSGFCRLITARLYVRARENSRGCPILSWMVIDVAVTDDAPSLDALAGFCSKPTRMYSSTNTIHTTASTLAHAGQTPEESPVYSTTAPNDNWTPLGVSLFTRYDSIHLKRYLSSCSIWKLFNVDKYSSRNDRRAW